MPQLRVWCPRCEQGWVVAVHIPLVGRDGLLCEECDALWFASGDVGVAEWVDFSTYMEQHGGRGLWSEVIRV